MIIDVHAHPLLFDLINRDQEDLEFRKQGFGVYKSSIAAVDFFLRLSDHAKVDRTVLLAEDYSAVMARPIVSNEEIARIVAYAPGRFIGFASVDPRRKDARDSLVRAFEDLKLSGLKLNLSHLHMTPDDERLKPLLETCLQYDKPVTFHAGYSWEPDSPSKYSRPILFEDIACDYPDLRFCLAHLGFPWIYETIMMLMKYPNVYADTATVFMDSPRNYYRQIFMTNFAEGWTQNCFQDKIMYGSNTPRFRQERSLDGILNLPFRKDVIDKITGENAQRFLGLSGMEGK